LVTRWSPANNQPSTVYLPATTKTNGAIADATSYTTTHEVR
jgi:hypothetical protein